MKKDSNDMSRRQFLQKLGFGTFWIVFSRTFLTLDIGYHWVREHYDPFIEKDVSGGRWQMNLGFSVFVY